MDNAVNMLSFDDWVDGQLLYEDVCKKIRAQEQSLQSCLILKGLLDSLPYARQLLHPEGKITKEIIMEPLMTPEEDQDSLITSLLKCITAKKEAVLKATKAKFQPVQLTVQILNKYIDGPNVPYMEQMSCFLDFIKFVHEACAGESFTPGVSLDLLNALWAHFVTNALVPEERDVFFKWLVLVLSPSSKVKIENLQDISSFYQENFSAYKGGLTSQAAFYCFREIFCIINLR